MTAVTGLLRRSTAGAILCGLWAATALALAVLDPAALTASSVIAVLQFSTILALTALGQALVILCGGGGIDLSVGGTTSLTAVLALLMLRLGLPDWSLPPACLIVGVLLGLLNGVLVTRLHIIPLIATLGTFYIFSGLAVSLTNGAAQGGVPAWLLPWGREAIGVVPLPFVSLALPAFLIAALLLGATSWGRWVYAVGHNERSARLVGIDVDRLRITAYGASGGLAGAAALVSLAWLGSGRPNIGQNLELVSLTAAMLGGVSIAGGRGGVGGVLAAVLLLVTIQTGLLQLNVNSIWQVGIVGALLILVLVADHLIARRS